MKNENSILQKVCTKIGSGATPTGGKESYKKEGISLIREQNVLDYKFSYDGLAKIDEEQAAKLNGVTVEENDILLNITGDSVARMCIVPKEVLPARVNQHVAIIRADGVKADPNFLLYYLQYNKESLLALAEDGATRKALTKVMLDEFPFIAPDITGQKKIVESLVNLDSKITLLYKQNQTIEEMAQAEFRRLFLDIDSDDVITVEDIAYLDNCSINPAKKPLETFMHYSIPAYDDDLTPSTDLGKTILSNKYEVKPMTIMVSKLNPGTPRIWRIGEFVDDNSVSSTEFQILQPRDSKYYLFLYCLMRSTNVVRAFDMSTTGTSSSHQRIQPEDIIEVETINPDEDSLSLFNETFMPLMKQIDRNLKEIKTLKRMRNVLLPQLLSGELKVGD